MGAPGPTERMLGRAGHRYAGTARAVVGVSCAVLAPFAGPPAGVLVCGVVAFVFVGWNVVYLREMRSRARHRVWLADLAVVAALCVAQPLLVDPELVAEQLSWVSTVASFTVVVAQWNARPLAAAAGTVVVVAAYVLGASASSEVGVATAVLAGGGAWMVIEAGLSRLLWHLVRRSARIADGVLEARVAQERDAATEAARRAEQRRHWATVHDTAASTLLMVGLGEVSGREPWLPAQLARDIAALDSAHVSPDTPGLAQALAATITVSPLRIRLDADRTTPAIGTPRLPADVVVAVDGAVREALENVRRHAGTGWATVRVRHAPDGLLVEIADDGEGFDPAAVPSGHYGLSVSVQQRMADVGGAARVESGPGAGTRVVLEWPDV